MTTNRDKLNKMTNEELAEFLNKIANENCLVCTFAKLDACPVTDCENGILQWLNQENEGDKQ